MTTFTVPCGQCGVHVKVRLEAVGKKAHCPKCQDLFIVPPPQAILVTPETVPETPPPQAIPVTPQATDATPDSRQPSCPSCQKLLPPEAKICVDCGLDLRTGKKLQTVIEKKNKTPHSTATVDPPTHTPVESPAAPGASDTFGLVEQDNPPGPAASGLRTCLDCGNDFSELLDDCPLCDNHRPRSRTRVKAERKSWQERLAPSRQGLIQVHTGLVLHRYRILTYTNGLALLLAASLLSVPTAAVVRSIAFLLLVLGVGGYLAAAVTAPILGMIGSAYCLRVPREAEARHLILISLILDVVQLPAGLVGFFLGPYAPLASLVGVIAWTFLLLFLKRLAESLDQPDLAGTAWDLLVRGILLLLAPFGLLLGAMALASLVALVGNVLRVLGIAILLLGILVLLGLALYLLSAFVTFLGDFLKLLDLLCASIRGERKYS